MEPVNYTRAEERRVLEQLRRHEDPACPRCASALIRRRVPPREGVAYVRDRLWLVCGSCRRSMVLERVDGP